MILLLALLLALPILGLMAAVAVPLAVIAAPAIAVLAIMAAPALAIAALAGAFSTANVSVPVLDTLEVVGIAVGVVAFIAALVYIGDRLSSRAQVPAPRAQEVPVGAREQVIVQPQAQPQPVISVTQQPIPADVAAQCQYGQLAPCPV